MMFLLTTLMQCTKQYQYFYSKNTITNSIFRFFEDVYQFSHRIYIFHYAPTKLIIFLVGNHKKFQWVNVRPSSYKENFDTMLR